MNCEYCPLFHCKLKSDLTRHLATKSHKHNAENVILHSKKNEVKVDAILRYHLDYITWSYKMRHILVDVRDVRGLNYGCSAFRVQGRT